MEGRAKLKRRLGLFEATLSGPSIILGAVLYVLLGKAADLFQKYGVGVTKRLDSPDPGMGRTTTPSTDWAAGAHDLR